jgi:hypothetical protein
VLEPEAILERIDRIVRELLELRSQVAASLPTPASEGNGLDADSDFAPDCQRASSGMRSKNIHCHSGSICCSSVGSLCASMNTRVPAVSGPPGYPSGPFECSELEPRLNVPAAHRVGLAVG